MLPRWREHQQNVNKSIFALYKIPQEMKQLEIYILYFLKTFFELQYYNVYCFFYRFTLLNKFTNFKLI